MGGMFGDINYSLSVFTNIHYLFGLLLTLGVLFFFSFMGITATEMGFGMNNSKGMVYCVRVTELEICNLFLKAKYVLLKV